jgi:HK97 family phage major capsid protein
MTTKEIKQNLLFQRSLLKSKHAAKVLSDEDFSTIDQIVSSVEALTDAVANYEDKQAALDKIEASLKAIRETLGLDESEGESLPAAIEELKKQLADIKGGVRAEKKTIKAFLNEQLKDIGNSRGAVDFRVKLSDYVFAKRAAAAQKSVTLTPANTFPNPEYRGLVEELILSGKLSQVINVGRTALQMGALRVAVESSTGEAAEVAMSATKPEINPAYTAVDVNVITIAAFIRCAKQILHDVEWLENAISNLLIRKVRKAWEKYLFTVVDAAAIAYDGTTNAEAIDLPQVADVIRTLAIQISLSGFDAKIVSLLNPADYGAMVLLKDKNGNYLNTEAALAGITVTDDVNVPAGKVYLFDATYINALVNEQDLEARIFEQDADNVTKNLVTILAELYCVAWFEVTGACVSGNIAAIKAAIDSDVEPPTVG